MTPEHPQTGRTAHHCAMTLQFIGNGREIWAKRRALVWGYFGSQSSQMEDTHTFMCKDSSTLALCNETANILARQSDSSPFLPSSFSMICLLLSVCLTRFFFYLSSTTRTS